MTDLIFINPDMQITIAKKQYTVKGTINFINDIQRHFNLPFNRIAEKIEKGDLMLSDYAEIIRHGIEGGGDDSPSLDAVMEYIVDDIGLDNAKYYILWFFQACVAPAEARGEILRARRESMESYLAAVQKEAQRTSKAIKKNGTPQTSPSATTEDSA